MPTDGLVVSPTSLPDRAMACEVPVPGPIPVRSICLGGRLIELREARELKQRHFLRQLGMRSYDAWELNKRRTPFPTLPLIAGVLGVEVHDLLHGIRFAERAYVAWYTRKHRGIFDEQRFAGWCLDQPEPETIAPEPNPVAPEPEPKPARRPAFWVLPPMEPSRPERPILGPVSVVGRNVVHIAQDRWVLRCRSCRSEHRVPLGRHAPRTCESCSKPLAANISVRVNR